MLRRLIARALSGLFLLHLLAGGAAAAAAGTTADTTLLVIGDTGDCRTAGAARVAAAMRQQADWREAVLVETGDLAYPEATRERLLQCHEPHFGDFPKRLAVPGNHDWAVPDAAGFHALFPEALPRLVPLAGPWRVVLLDSNLRGAAWQAQVAWLERTVASAPGQCLIPVWHHPRFSSGNHGDNSFIAPLWERIAGIAPFTLHGHDHNYEALPPLDASGQASATGTRAFVTGFGGTWLKKPGKVKRSERAIYDTWGFLRIDLRGRGYAWQAFDTEGRVLDQGHGECAAPAAASAKPALPIAPLPVGEQPAPRPAR